MFSLVDLSAKLKREKSVALICHVRPDGDTLGSALALSLCLNNLGIKAEVVCDDAVPSRFLFLKSASLVKRELEQSIASYSALIAIDSADITRLGCFSEGFDAHKNTYSIDHHISNPRYAKYNYVVDNASNCENVLALIKEMGGQITTEMANLLAMGIMTDTGNFRHKNVTPSTLVSASELVEKGADLTEIYYHMFTKQSKARAKLFGLVMSKIRYFLDDKLAIATVMQNDIELANAKSDETEGFIDFLMGIETVEVGVCILQVAENKFKVSFRSKGADVSAVAGMFGGGGHVLASGCQISGEYEEVVDKLTFAVSRYIEE